jgi:ribosomal protein S6
MTSKINTNDKSNENAKNNIYELAVMFKPDVGVESAEQKIRSFISLINECQGKVEKEDVMREIVLAYPIKKYKRALFWVSYFTLKNADPLKKIQNELNIDSTLLRYIIIKKKEIPKSESESMLEKQTAKLKTQMIPTTAQTEIPASLENIQKTTLKETKKTPKTRKTKVNTAISDQTQTKTKLEEIDKKIEEILEGEIK